jgi:hypothetical protein
MVHHKWLTKMRSLVSVLEAHHIFAILAPRFRSNFVCGSGSVVFSYPNWQQSKIFQIINSWIVKFLWFNRQRAYLNSNKLLYINLTKIENSSMSFFSKKIYLFEVLHSLEHKSLICRGRYSDNTVNRMTIQLWNLYLSLYGTGPAGPVSRYRSGSVSDFTDPTHMF